MTTTPYKDYLQDDDGDLLIRNGDFIIDESDKQHITDIVVAYPGWFKNFPAVGVGIRNYLGSSGRQQEIARNVKIQLEADGFTVGSPGVTLDATGQMIIKPMAYRQ